MHMVGVVSLPGLMVAIALIFTYAARRPRPEAGPDFIAPQGEADVGDDPVIRGFVGLVKWLLIDALFGGTLALLLVKGL